MVSVHLFVYLSANYCLLESESVCVCVLVVILYLLKVPIPVLPPLHNMGLCAHLALPQITQTNRCALRVKFYTPKK